MLVGKDGIAIIRTRAWDAGYGDEVTLGCGDMFELFCSFQLSMCVLFPL